MRTIRTRTIRADRRSPPARPPSSLDHGRDGACRPARSPATARLKEVNGRSFCAFSGQEDLQWFTDDGDTVRLENPVKGVPGHAQSWGQIPKAVRDAFPADLHPGISCNPNKSTFGE